MYNINIGSHRYGQTRRRSAEGTAPLRAVMVVRYSSQISSWSGRLGGENCSTIIVEQNIVNEVKIQLSYIVSCISSTHYASEVNIVITMSWTSVKSHYMVTGTTYCFNAIFLIPKEKLITAQAPSPLRLGSMLLTA